MFEILTFRLGPGVTEADFRAVDERVQVGFAYQQPGFLRRTLGRADDGRWLALTVWSDAASATAADDAFRASPLGQEFLGLLVDVGVDRFHGVH